MSFRGVNINKLNGGLGRSNPNEDNIFILAACMPITGTTVTLYEPVKLLQHEDAVALGIDAAFDANESVLVYNEIKDFFTYCPDGVLHLIPVAETLSPSGVVAVEAFITAVRSVPEAKVIGIMNTTTAVPEIDEEVEAVQLFVDNFREEFRYIDNVLLEGRGEAAAITPVANYPDLRAKNAPNVSVSIAQDPAVATIDAAYTKYAAIGSVLGMLAVRQVNENLGSVDILNKPIGFRGREDYPLTIDGTSRWEASNLSDGNTFETLSYADQKALTNSGYIYAGSFSGYGGVFFNSAPTCVEKADDYAYIENNRVWNKAVRIIRETLIPRVRGIVKKDALTGYIKSTTISDWNSRLNKAMEVMITNNEISGFEFYINPKQTLSEDTPLKVTGHIVVDAIVFEFEVDLGLTDKL
ncbi:conserved hypothetical protein (DUF2586) [Formosa agariphila KMM 3901]|uniref:Uncharacterized protein n=1 Tax=Formosa agariphila (strain DSM 15362 / KCTC 12365 / LMG 23005 / KMM 3901 / M-2Alg 35-1) TaxID=1347342 RepID=T2KNX5_FORAG|nr:DUF2586 family protein [Formosa agariphila]CDF80572.1 conserved hypothetical protein (DUF2586) [Formosa agariphila KMM 3901]